jgi:glucose-1-phosphate adenylyltransferase
VGIGAGSHIRRAIIDKNVRMGMDCKIINAAGVQEANREESFYIIKDGIVTILKDAILPPGTVI